MISNGNATAANSSAKSWCEHRTRHDGKILGLEPIGPVSQLEDGAVLDMKPREALCFSVAAILEARKISFIFPTVDREPSTILPELRAAQENVVARSFLSISVQEAK